MKRFLNKEEQQQTEKKQKYTYIDNDKHFFSGFLISRVGTSGGGGQVPAVTLVAHAQTQQVNSGN